MAVPIQLTFDCADPDRLARFWAAALDYQLQPPPAGFDSWPAFLAARGVPRELWDARSAIIDPTGAGPRVFFQKVPEGKSAKNRVHIDVHASGGRGFPIAERKARVEAAAGRLARAGATRVRAFDEPALDDYWVVMLDPEGNEFCVI